MGVACRVRAFGKEGVIQRLSDDYIAVTASLNKVDGWRDDDSTFFDKVHGQLPDDVQQRDKSKQGMYMVTADGKLLNYCNSFKAMHTTKDHLDLGLEAWRRLPLEKRRPGAIEVPGMSVRKVNELPPNGVVLRVYSRQLDRLQDNVYADAKGSRGRGDEASIDNLWLTETEWKSMLPRRPYPGKTHPVPQAIIHRIAQFHLKDGTRGHFLPWKRDSVRNATLQTTVLEVNGGLIRLRLDGSVRIEGAERNSTIEQSYEPTLVGFLNYNRRSGQLLRFDLVAIGDQRGKPDFRARDGRNPLGIAIELSDGHSPRDRIPPGGIGGHEFNQGYFGKKNPL